MTLHAVLTLNLCFESYGAAVHLMDSLFSSGMHLGSRRAGGPAVSAPPSPVESFAHSVQRSTDAMPFDQAHALWLVDVCGCSYDQAALETGSTREIVSSRITNGRRFIRANVTDDLLRPSVS